MAGEESGRAKAGGCTGGAQDKLRSQEGDVDGDVKDVLRDKSGGVLQSAHGLRVSIKPLASEVDLIISQTNTALAMGSLYVLMQLAS
eukprot:CAMPEP_0184353216 /NCGR_PEP_ID=MMETSP1089-20130417/76154_1 /TAXON_ID=38269 ORGANISM="Gloeochaete wittrockiana, Strain SAG46.84" /NCGR_SAMPLE_ID=MMETSP1089 /ASSEMBLY_ACC=CAM_ASM_000445 /LENGTH=86 /DNA_ID=CAMNT_0026688431 /DNA_START=152 /DNA_END=409 /DNA_ORIENTATION=-